MLAALTPIEDKLRAKPADGTPPVHAKRRKATFGDLLAELKRRHVFRVMVGYGIFAFAVLQVTEPIMHGADLPNWVLKAVLIALVLGFPVAVVLAWVYDLTAQGVKRTSSASGPGAPSFGRARVLLPLGVSVAVLAIAVAGAGAWYAWKRIPGQSRGSTGPGASLAGEDGRIAIAVADFANDTRDPDLDGLSVLLTTSLEQSKTLRVLTRGALADALRRLGQSSLERIDETLARRAGVEAGVRALLLASVRKLDDVYAIEMRAVDPRQDEYLFTVRERTVGKKGMLDVIDRLSERVRAELKEPGREIAARNVRVGLSATSSLEANAHYFRAQQVMAETLNSDRALEEYRRALELDPDFPQAHLQVALLMALGEADGTDAESEAHLAAVMRQADRIPERDRRLAEVLQALGAPLVEAPEKRTRVGEMLRDVVAAYPDSKELLALAGGHAVSGDDYEQAVLRLEAALRLDPGYGPALVWLSTAYDKLGRKAEAVAAAQRAVAARPGPVSYAVLAQSLAVNGQRDEAVAAARRVYGFGGAVPFFVSEMVWPVHAYVGDWKQAEDEVRRWTGSDSLPARRMMSLSALSFLLNAQGRAAEIREVAAQLGAGPPPELSVWATAMADLLEGNDAGAARQFREAAGVDGADVVAYLGDLRGADALARELKAGSVPADLHRAVDAWKRGSPTTAIPILREVIARTDDGGATRYLGEILCEGEQPAAGAALLEKWLGRFPSAVSLGMFVFRPRVLIHLAKCQDRLGRRPEARATVQRFLSEWNRADSGLPLLAEAKAMQARLADARQ